MTVVYVAKNMDGRTYVYLEKPRWLKYAEAWDIPEGSSPDVRTIVEEQDLPEIEPGQCVEASLVPLAQ